MIPFIQSTEADLDPEWFSVAEGLMVKLPKEPGPEIPPPCWDDRPVDAERCHQATKALCG